MKIYLQFIGLTFCVLALAGCEWTSGGGVNSWSDSQNFADFSGSYQAADGNVLVRQFGATNAVTTNTTFTTNTVSGELLATGNGTLTAFNGQLANSPVRGSLTIFTIGGYRFTDSAALTTDTVPLTVTPADGSAGTFNYSTRAWALTFPAPLTDGTQILATYQYPNSTQVITPLQGNHGNAIFSFIVYQTGNKLQITDSNGATYEGTLGTMRTTGGKPINLNNSASVPPTTGPVVAQFSATGVSQGFNVTLVGVLQGTLSIVAGGGSLSARSMQATFIEENGNEANVNAVAK